MSDRLNSHAHSSVHFLTFSGWVKSHIDCIDCISVILQRSVNTCDFLSVSVARYFKFLKSGKVSKIDFLSFFLFFFPPATNLRVLLARYVPH